MWERQQRGWGIRNIKLRFSRKLLFVWGLLAAFSGELFADPSLQTVESDDEYYHLLAELIREQTDVAPLELLARVLVDLDDDSVANTIFSSYDEFLAALADPDVRESLEVVRFDDAATDPSFERLRTASREFRGALNRLFFDIHPKLPKLIRDYGVF